MLSQELHLLFLVKVPHLLTCDTHTVVQLCYADLTGKCGPTHCGSHCEPSFEEWEFEREKGNADTRIKQDIGALPLYFPCVAGIHVLAFCLFGCGLRSGSLFGNVGDGIWRATVFGFLHLEFARDLGNLGKGEFAGKVGEQFTVRDGDALTTDEVYDTLTALIYKDRRCRPTGRRFITTYEIPTERVFEVLVIELNQVERGFDGAVLLCERKHRGIGNLLSVYIDTLRSLTTEIERALLYITDLEAPE